MRMRLKGVQKVKMQAADGSALVYYYHRATRQKLTGKYGTQEFLASWQAAEATMLAPSTRLDDILSGLIKRYEGSTSFQDLAESTKSIWKLYLRKIDAEWGQCPIKGLEEIAFKRDAIVWHEAKARSSKRSAWQAGL